MACSSDPLITADAEARYPAALVTFIMTQHTFLASTEVQSEHLIPCAFILFNHLEACFPVLAPHS